MAYKWGCDPNDPYIYWEPILQVDGDTLGGKLTSHDSLTRKNHPQFAPSLRHVRHIPPQERRPRPLETLGGFDPQTLGKVTWDPLKGDRIVWKLAKHDELPPKSLQSIPFSQKKKKKENWSILNALGSVNLPKNIKAKPKTLCQSAKQKKSGRSTAYVCYRLLTL